MLTAGDLDQLVQLERDTVSHSSGVETRTPAVYASAYAEVKPFTGREAWVADQIRAEAKYRLRMYYRTDIVGRDRVVFGAQKLEVIDVQNDRGEWTTTLICKVFG